MPVYMVQVGEHGPVKIGWTDNLRDRLIQLQISNYQTLTVLRVFAGGIEVERQLHDRFADQHLRGEWFSFCKSMLGDLGLVDTYTTDQRLRPIARQLRLIADLEPDEAA